MRDFAISSSFGFTGSGRLDHGNDVGMRPQRWLIVFYAWAANVGKLCHDIPNSMHGLRLKDRELRVKLPVVLCFVRS